MDTCCIDKKSSAELSEAINSMYRIYETASICIVHLDDLASNETAILPDGRTVYRAWKFDEEEFKQARWFSRGWTLQEMLAPKSRLEFFDRNWERIGSRDELLHPLIAATGIEFVYWDQPKVASAATRMSWASRRKTTRIEDTAYCLMGLFDVNMPLLYGEGEKAFERLQKEILMEKEDASIFAWKNPSLAYSGLLASSPECFAESANVVGLRWYSMSEDYRFSARGLKMSLFARETPKIIESPWKNHICFEAAFFACDRQSRKRNQYLKIQLLGFNKHRPFLRANADQLEFFEEEYPIPDVEISSFYLVPWSRGLPPKVEKSNLNTNGDGDMQSTLDWINKKRKKTYAETW